MKGNKITKEHADLAFREGQRDAVNNGKRCCAYSTETLTYLYNKGFDEGLSQLLNSIDLKWIV